MNKNIGLLAFVALAWWWTSSEALTPTSRFGIRYAPGDTLIVAGTALLDTVEFYQPTLKVHAHGGTSTTPETLTVANIIARLSGWGYVRNVHDTADGYVHLVDVAGVVADKDATGRATGAVAVRLATHSGALQTLYWIGVDSFVVGDSIVVVANKAVIGDLRVAGVVHIGDNADSAAAHDLAVQSGLAFSRLDAGSETFEITSDEALKTGFEAVNTAAIREATLALPPPRQWQYRTEALRHEPHLALIRADSSRAAVEREVDERLAQEDQDGRTLNRADVEAEIRTARTASVVEQEAAYLQQVERRAGIKHTGWTAQELYPLAQVIRPESASPTSTRLTDRVIGLVVTTQAQQGEIDDLKAAVYDPKLGGVPLVTYVLGLAGLVTALSAYVATLKKQVNDLEARIAKLEGVAPNPPNLETEN